MPLPEFDVALDSAFQIEIDGRNLGFFTGCEGLGAEVVLESRREGGNNGFVWQLPTNVSYPNIRLTRPLTAETTKIAEWGSGLMRGVRRHTGRLVAFNSHGEPVAEWGLLDVVPVRWSGPSVTAGSAAALTETLEIAHQGFIDSRSS
jgi:phage tail-like protein